MFCGVMLCYQFLLPKTKQMRMSFDVGVEIHISHAEMNVCVQRCKITMLKQLIQLRYFMSYMPGSFLNSTLNIMPAFSQARE